MINNPLALASNETTVTHHASGQTVRVLCDVHTRRRMGLIINHSKHTLLVYFGKQPPTNRKDYLAIPHFANADIPFFYVGKIFGYWEGIDSLGATIHEFYGDFS
jgi:hypothetical protein